MSTVQFIGLVISTGNSEVVYTFTPNKPYSYLVNVEPINSVFWKNYKTEFNDIIIKFTNQNGRPFKIEDKINFPLLNNK